MDDDLERRKPLLLTKLRSKASQVHNSIPWIRKLPGEALAIVLLLIAVNVLVWIACGIVLSLHTSLVSTAVLSYTLGLRHALDADHIAAIDLMTRRLIASGQRPVTVGTFFSLGHSTIVIVTSIVVAASSAAIQDRFGSFSTVGGIIGSSISSAFLIILGLINIYILHKLYSALQAAITSPDPSTTGPVQNIFTPNNNNNNNGGCLTPLLSKLFHLIDRPWKMYPLGILFGLGFDTSSEIALLGISSITATNGTSLWLILLFPILFTAGMCLLDTIDGAAMMSLYTSARLAKDEIAVLYYQCVLTAVTVCVALVIGVIQLLNLVLNVRPELEEGGGAAGRFWEGVAVAGDYYDVIGGAICGSFVLFGGLSVVLYRPWRRGVDRRREAMGLHEVVEGDERDDREDGGAREIGVEDEGVGGSSSAGNVKGHGRVEETCKGGIVSVAEER